MNKQTENMADPKAIISAILERLNMNMRAFALGANLPYTRIHDICSGRTTTLSSAVMKAIRDTYGINERFLETGEGEILKEQVTATPPLSDEVTAAYVKLIAAYSNEVMKLKEERTDLLKKVIELKARIAELEEMITENDAPEEDEENEESE